MNEHIRLLFNASTEQTLIKSLEEYSQTKYNRTITTLFFAEVDQLTENTTYLLYLCDQEIQAIFQKEKPDSVDFAILPHDRCLHSVRSYGIRSDLFEAIDDLFSSAGAINVDLLICNGTPVIGNIIIGDVHGMNRRSKKKRYFEKIFAFFSDLKHLSFHNYTITTAKGNVTSTAATGIMVFEHNVSDVSHNLLNENLSLHDGRVHALILAPASVAGYLYYLFLSYFFNKVLMEQLPESIGLIASSSFEISSSRPVEYLLDGELHTDEKLLIEVVRDAVKIHLGPNIQDIPVEATNEEVKETVRVHGLPKGDRVNLLISEPIPFLPRASEEDFKELFIGLKQNAKLSSVYIVLIILSTLLATTGLFQNSTPVIIGAMVLAPLMTPIISLAMGVVRAENVLLKESSITLLVGIATALAFSCLYTVLMPLTLLTQEMQGRVNPNVLDLMVAIISGIAGAYAHAKSEIAKSLAGVAIAVALVPPLSVTGIGIGWWDTEMIYGSFLLFITNLAGITLAASLTFLVLGFSPLKRATKGIIWTSLILVLITIPLFLSFFTVIEQNKIFTQLKRVEDLVLDEQKIRISVLSVDLSKEKPVIYLETRSAKVLSTRQLLKIKEQIDNIVHREVVVNILAEVELD